MRATTWWTASRPASRSAGGGCGRSRSRRRLRQPQPAQRRRAPAARPLPTRPRALAAQRDPESAVALVANRRRRCDRARPRLRDNTRGGVGGGTRPPPTRVPPASVSSGLDLERLRVFGALAIARPAAGLAVAARAPVAAAAGRLAGAAV